MKILVIVCVRSPILLSCCTPKQCHLVFYNLAICQFFPCLLKFNKSRGGCETTFRELLEHYAGNYSLPISQFSLRRSPGEGEMVLVAGRGQKLNCGEPNRDMGGLSSPCRPQEEPAGTTAWPKHLDLDSLNIPRCVTLGYLA